MATSFAFDPITYVHPSTHRRHGIQYGPGENQNLDLFVHVLAGPTDPLLIHAHGGAYIIGDKTSYSEGSRLMRPIYGTLLDYEHFDTGMRCSYASIELEQVSHLNTGILTDGGNYVPTRVPAVRPGEGCYSLQAYILRAVRSCQMAIQFLKDMAKGLVEGYPRMPWDPDALVGSGFSMGGLTMLQAIFTASRAWHAHNSGGGQWDRFSDASLRGVWPLWAEVTTDPRWMDQSITAMGFGCDPLDVGVSNERLNEMLITRDASGNFSEDSEPLPLCRRTSPIHLIADAPERFKSRRVLAHYSLQEATPGNVYPMQASGHDYRQWAMLRDACQAKGVPFDTVCGKVLDIAGEFGGSQQLAIESTLPGPTGAWNWIKTTTGV